MSLAEEIKVEAEAIGMSEIQLNAIMGSLLGDGYVGQRSQSTSFIRWNHGAKQKDYVNAKYQLLKEFASKEPYETPNPGYGDTWCILTLKPTILFRLLRYFLYSIETGKKTVTKEYLDMLTHPISLAWLFMDDGTRNKDANFGQIATNSFSKEEVELMQQWMLERWGLPTNICQVHHTSTGKEAWVLLIPKESFIKMSELIAPYVPESMRYKINVITQTCPVCGKIVPRAQSIYCCQECAVKGRKAYDHQYYLDHLTEHQEQAKRYREEHKEEIAEKKKDWMKKHLESMTDEELEAYKEHRREMERKLYSENQASHEKRLASKKAYRERHKGDPEYEAALKAERKRYYEKLMADPERRARRLANSRLQKQRAAEKKRLSSQENTPSTGTESQE